MVYRLWQYAVTQTEHASLNFDPCSWNWTSEGMMNNLFCQCLESGRLVPATAIPHLCDALVTNQGSSHFNIDVLGPGTDLVPCAQGLTRVRGVRKHNDYKWTMRKIQKSFFRFGALVLKSTPHLARYSFVMWLPVITSPAFVIFSP
jgi:hypothetical protein